MIYIAAHKKFDVPQMDNYIPLHVGAEGKDSLGYCGDNTGDNISIKNPNFCELTGLYWIWKNTSDPYKGLVHYRRYFGKSNISSSLQKIYSYDELLQMLNHSDIVLPYIESFKQNAKDEILIECCTEEIFDKLENIIARKYPEYVSVFNEVFAGNRCFLFNMMFCKAEIFDDYCQWLFDILFELEKNIDISNLNSYQKRIYGFLSERLLNVWVKHNKYNVRNVKVINVEMKLSKKIQIIRRRLTNQIYFDLHKK